MLSELGKQFQNAPAFPQMEKQKDGQWDDEAFKQKMEQWGKCFGEKMKKWGEGKNWEGW